MLPPKHWSLIPERGRSLYFIINQLDATASYQKRGLHVAGEPVACISAMQCIFVFQPLQGLISLIKYATIILQRRFLFPFLPVPSLAINKDIPPLPLLLTIRYRLAKTLIFDPPLRPKQDEGFGSYDPIYPWQAL